MFRWTLCAVTLVVGWALGSPASAAQTDLGFGIGIAHSDNIAFEPEDGTDSTVQVAAARLDTTDRTADHEARLRGTVEYRNYTTDLYPSQLLFSFDSAAIWTVDTGMTWFVEDYFRQAPVNVFAPPDPANRQNANVFSGGPEATWRLSSRSALVAGGRYGNFFYERSDADSHRLSTYGRWLYGLTPRSDVSVNAELSTMNFQEDRYSDFTRLDGFVTWKHRLSRSEIEADVGATALRRERLDDLNGFLGRLGWHMAFNSRSSVRAYLQEQLTDAGHDILETAARGGSVGYTDQQVTGDVFYSQHAEAGYDWHGVRASWRLAGSTRTENYQSSPVDRKVEEASAGFGYEVTPTLRAGLTGSYQRAEYLQTDQLNKDKRGRFRLEYRANTNLYATADFTRNERDSNFASEEFVENRVMFTLWYQRGAPPEIGGPFGNDRGLLLQPRQPVVMERRSAPPVEEE